MNLQYNVQLLFFLKYPFKKEINFKKCIIIEKIIMYLPIVVLYYYFLISIFIKINLD